VECERKVKRAKEREKNEGRLRDPSLLSFFPALSPALFFARPPLSECLEQAISSVNHLYQNLEILVGIQEISEIDAYLQGSPLFPVKTECWKMLYHLSFPVCPVSQQRESSCFINGLHHLFWLMCFFDKNNNSYYYYYNNNYSKIIIN